MTTKVKKSTKKTKSMATRPTKFPRWATVPYLDPVVGGSNVVEPPEQQKDDGWARKQKPPANYQNWLHNLTYLWLEYLDGVAAELPKDYRSGVLLANNSTDPAKDVDFEAGAWRSKDNTTNLILTATMVKQMDADWAEGTNEGGFPSGLTLTANTTYHSFLIGKPDGTTDSGVDSDIDASNLLSDAVGAGYTKFVRVGSVRTNSGDTDIRPFFMRILGDQRVVYWKAITLDYSLGNPGTAAILVELITPVDVNTIAIFNAYLEATGASSDLYAAFPLQDDQVPSSIAAPLHQISSDSVVGGRDAQLEIMTNTDSEIRYRLSASDASTKVRFATIGYIE